MEIKKKLRTMRTVTDSRWLMIVALSFIIYHLSFSTAGAQEPRAELTLQDQSKVYYNIDDLKSIDVSGTTITVVPKTGNAVVYDRKVTNIAFIPSGNSHQLSPNTQRLLSYLQSIYGVKTLSAAMANVNWNTYEAQWVFKHTGRWPAINCFDFIHHVWSSPGGWIDYSNSSVVENWHNQGGIVAAMWHWNVPANDGQNYAFYYGNDANKKNEQTTFDVRKIFEPNSSEYQRMVSDIDKIISYLKPLQQKDIPVIWRPLHEAGGKWFWWGMDAEACKELWRVMYQRFQQAGLNNIIWAFTPAASWGRPFSDGFLWYPGDEYVDIVGFDIYNVWSAQSIYTDYFHLLEQQCRGKLVGLTEFGNVAQLSQQWQAGAKWLFFMPWYDYGRTNNPNAAAFNQQDHSSANITWWKNAWAQDYVLSRDQVNYRR